MPCSGNVGSMVREILQVKAIEIKQCHFHCLCYKGICSENGYTSVSTRLTGCSWECSETRLQCFPIFLGNTVLTVKLLQNRL